MSETAQALVDEFVVEVLPWLPLAVVILAAWMLIMTVAAVWTLWELMMLRIEVSHEVRMLKYEVAFAMRRAGKDAAEQ